MLTVQVFRNSHQPLPMVVGQALGLVREKR
jgi:hypothetical protein